MALVDGTDQVWLYDQLNSELVPAGADLFGYILKRFCEPCAWRFLNMQPEIRAWWDDHRAIKSDIMYLVVRAWTLNCEKSEITAKVMDYLNCNAAYLPCGPKKFYDAYFEHFWPEF